MVFLCGFWMDTQNMPFPDSYGTYSVYYVATELVCHGNSRRDAWPDEKAVSV